MELPSFNQQVGKTYIMGLMIIEAMKKKGLLGKKILIVEPDNRDLEKSNASSVSNVEDEGG